MEKSDYAGIFLICLASLLIEKQPGSQKTRNCFKVIVKVITIIPKWKSSPVENGHRV